MAQKIMQISDAAASKIREIISSNPEPVAGLRVGVKKGGCAGMEYMIEYANEAKPYEDVIEEKGVKVFIDPAAVMYLIGTTMDYETSKLASKFVFKNPNQISSCGCGESVSLAPAPEVQT